MWTGFFVLIVLVIYRNTDSVAGWSRGDAFVLIASCFLLESLHSAFCFSLLEIPEQVRKGTLDFVLVKPVDPQFWVSLRRFNFSQGGTMLAGVGLLIAGMVMTGQHPSPAQWIAYVSLLLSGLILFYSFNLALMTLGIWLVRVDNLWVLSESVLQVSRFPLDIFGVSLRRLLTYALPLAFIATIPTRQLIQGLDVPMLTLGLVWSLGALAAARAFWKFALTRYQSASS
ncbi:MAG: ABC transporter permease [Fimbriimonadaceae bacterium]|nr:ABC transporter permease [Fimbriimonadaceae bacterium]